MSRLRGVRDDGDARLSLGGLHLGAEGEARMCPVLGGQGSRLWGGVLVVGCAARDEKGGRAFAQGIRRGFARGGPLGGMSTGVRRPAGEQILPASADALGEIVQACLGVDDGRVASMDPAERLRIRGPGIIGGIRGGGGWSGEDLEGGGPGVGAEKEDEVSIVPQDGGGLGRTQRLDLDRPVDEACPPREGLGRN